MSITRQATVTLGRDSLGEATEADFAAWVSYVCERIDAATGLDVDVETRGARDVQSDCIVANDADRETIRDAIATLWESFCADGIGADECTECGARFDATPRDKRPICPACR